jgi:hypothetical protein
VDDVPANLDEVASRRAGSANGYFPGASTQHLARLDQAIARSANAQAEIRQYDLEWRPTKSSLEAPGSIESTIGRMEARAAEAETRLDQLRFGPGGNLGPPLMASPRPTSSPSRPFDGGAWIDAYRGINNAPDLFGRPAWPADSGTVAAASIDGVTYFGVNSTAPGYLRTDWNRAADYRDALISKYPFTMQTDDIGRMPNDALFHAEATILLRASGNHGGSLENQSMEILVDREICRSCGTVLPKLGLELGNPYVVFIERGTGVRSEMWNGNWLSGRYR